MHTNTNMRFFTILQWLMKAIFVPVFPSGDRSVINEFISRLEANVRRWILTRGPLETIRMLKQLRVIIYRFLAEDPLFIVGVAQYKDGLPRILGYRLATLIRCGNTWAIRLVLTCLQVSRVIAAWKPVDLSTVFRPGVEITPLHEFYKNFVVKGSFQPHFGVGIPI